MRILLYFPSCWHTLHASTTAFAHAAHLDHLVSLEVFPQMPLKHDVHFFVKTWNLLTAVFCQQQKISWTLQPWGRVPFSSLSMSCPLPNCPVKPSNISVNHFTGLHNTRTNVLRSSDQCDPHCQEAETGVQSTNRSAKHKPR